MKHSNTKNIWSSILLWLLPLVLIVPNVALACTEYLYTPLERIANIVLPFGVYMLIAGCCKRIGLLSVLSLPLMILCAFQIVLIFLYGEGIIAIDMFLNVVTTNAGEVAELLDNMIPAIGCVCLLYLPPLVLGIILIRKHQYTTQAQRRPLKICGTIVSIAGVALLVAANVSDNSYAATRKLFPINVSDNLCTAVERTIEAKKYYESSADFKFDAATTRPDSSEIYVLVIGETSRSANWQLNGYARPTNPHLSARNGVTFYKYALSESNTTHKSVPLMLSHLNSTEFGDSIYEVKGICSAFSEAGIHTEWISNQEHNGNVIDFFGEEADNAVFLSNDGYRHRDMDIIGHLRHSLDVAGNNPTFIAIHTYGSHFLYRDRYPNEFSVFKPDDVTNAELSNREQLVNAYDNTIVYTDAVVDSIIGTIEQTGRPAVLLYLADHGEDIYDDSRKRFLHASPNPTYYQIHVPMLSWVSQAYCERYPKKVALLRNNANKQVSGSRSTFHTLLDLAGIVTPKLNSKAALSSSSYTEPERLYLTDYNEAVPLELSGLRELDNTELIERGITVQ